MLKPPSFLPRSKMGLRLLVPVLAAFAIGIGLLLIRPWDRPPSDCAVIVRPGESIQEAIEAAGAGDVICLARGEWNESIVIDRPLILVGRGAGRTVINTGMASLPGVKVISPGTDPIEVKIEGLTVSGTGMRKGVEIGGTASVEVKDCAVSGRHYGVQVSDSASLTITGSNVSGSTLRGVILTDSARACFRNSRIEDNGQFGLWLAGSARAVLSGSEISGNGSHGFWLRDEAKVELADCSISGNRGYGVRLMQQSEARLLHCRLSGNSNQGILAGDSAKVEITDCWLLSNWHGIELASEARATVTGSTVSRNKFDGIRIRQSARAAISVSLISANRRGIFLGGEAEAEIRDCIIEENRGFGVLSQHEANVAGSGNRFRGNGVDLGGSVSWRLRMSLRKPVESEITWPDDGYDTLQEAIDALLPGGKLLLEPGEYAAGLTIGKKLAIEAVRGQVTLKGKSDTLPVLSLVDGAELRLSGAALSGGSEGLLISGRAGALLDGCTVSHNLDGINLAHMSSLELAECSIAENERRGIFADGSARVTAFRCSISGNHETGVAAGANSHVTIADSIIAENEGKGGVLLWGSCRATLEGNRIAGNRGFGVAAYEPPCFPESPWSFRGRISGRANTFEGNRRNHVCPPELQFLGTAEGGKLDHLPQARPDDI